MSIRRERVTWVRWGTLGRTTVSHPWVWIWTDEDGYERCYDTKAEAVAARSSHS